MEKHVPMHPLPEEIQMMPRDETVCKYCGVSYLILHEFKLLEDKVKALEKELHFYKGSVEREKHLQEELHYLRQEYEQSKNDSESRAERLKIALLQLKEKEDDVQVLTIELTTCQEALRSAQDQKQLLGEKAAKQETLLRKSLSLLRLLQSEQSTIKNNVQILMGQWNILRRDLANQMKEKSAEMISLHGRLKESQLESVSLQNKVKNLQAVAESVTLTSKQLERSREKETELKSKCHELEKQISDLQQQLETVRTDFHNVTKELQHHKDISISTTKEANDLQNKLQRIEMDKDAIILRLTKDLRENSEAVTYDITQLQKEITEMRRMEENYKRRFHHLETELETMKEVLKQSEEEVVNMKQERELQIVSYQNRIEELQGALKQRMQNEDSWETKMQNELENQQRKYLLKIEETKKQLREEANVELAIERQKHEEMLKNFQNQNDALELKIPALISKACNELHTEVNMLERKLQEAQARLTGKDHAKDYEVANLKKIVSELEFRLQREQDHSISVSEEMRKDIHTKAEKLKELNLNCSELKHHLDQAKQEIEFLKETVRMECEERYELTEALTQAKQQLLEIKRSGGSFPVPQRQYTPDKPTSSHIMTGAQKKPPLTVPSSNGTKLLGLSGTYGSACAPNYNKLRKSSGGSLPMLQSPHPPKEKTSSLSDTRHKITAILRRNSTQP
ncbi:protein LEKR1 isoform X2 [Hyla sarda]|nr:protein LEKR1 isoform X2 [Hyla sarda]